jgi:hypothetical protein
MTFMTDSTFLKFATVVAILLASVSSPSEAFSMRMVGSGSSASKSSSIKPNSSLKTRRDSTTKIYYANSGRPAVTLDKSPTLGRKKSTKKQRLDPVQTIAFLNDPERKYKKSSMRPKLLSVLDRQRNAMNKAALKAQAQANFVFGQRSAERAIRSVLKEHGIEDGFIVP